LVTLVRQTEQTLLQRGEPITALGQQAQALLDRATTLRDTQRKRVAEVLNAALSSHARIRQQSPRLLHGQKLPHCKLVNASELTIAPLLKGKSNGPAPCGRKPGIASDPATGFIFAHHVPAGNPRDPSSVLPWLAKGHSALDRISAAQPLQGHAVAGDLGVNDTALRQALHARGMLTLGIPKTVEPIKAPPTAEEILDLLNAAGLNRRRPPYQVQLACACG
jgi:hypothetical protein